MLPAQPPNSRRIWGTRNATLSMWSLSGRMCVRKRSGNTMMVSYATDPQMSALFSALPAMPVSGFDGKPPLGRIQLEGALDDRPEPACRLQNAAERKEMGRKDTRIGGGLLGPVDPDQHFIGSGHKVR